MVETQGEKKQGIGMNYKGQWGYHPLVLTLAQTQEVLYLVNRPGNRPSHEGAAFYYDLAINECRKAGFREILLRGDTDFALTENFDRWDDAGVHFLFGIDAMSKLVQLAEALESASWKPLSRDRPAAGRKRRARRPNYKEQFVEEKGYQNLRLQAEAVAEFDYQPTKCSRAYRVVVVRKNIDVKQGQQLLFDTVRYFFYITNLPRYERPRQIVRTANARCDQENSISQLKASHALTAPLDNLVSNGAYMLIASLAWTLKLWSGLMIRSEGRKEQRDEQARWRQRVLRMEFATYCNAVIQIPASIIRRSRQLLYRLLSYQPSVDGLLLMHDHINRPLRC